jgi:hypothetical protein
MFSKVRFGDTLGCWTRRTTHIGAARRICAGRPGRLLRREHARHSRPRSSSSRSLDRARLRGGIGRIFHLLSIFRSHRSSRALRAGVLLTFALGVTTLLMSFAPTNAGAGAASFHYQSGYSIQSGWLCYGFSNGALHCTARWHRDSTGKPISDNPAWVPNVGGSPSGNPGGAPPLPTSSAGEPCRSGVYFNAATPTQWQVPPGCYAGVYHITPANYVYRSGFGWCNWWPEVMNPSRPKHPLGALRARERHAAGRGRALCGRRAGRE